MTFGYPDSLLLENDIDPQMLYELPEELRAEILSTIQDQFEEWQRQRNQAQPSHGSSVANNQPEGAELVEPVAAVGQANPVVEPEQLVQAEPQPQPAVVEEEMDPEVRQAIEMGLDPDFVRSLPADMRRELIQNESFRAANTGAPQPAPIREPEAMDVASIIATVQDPQLRREMLQNLTQEQIDNLPANLRTEAMNFRNRHAAGGGAFMRPEALLG